MLARGKCGTRRLVAVLRRHAERNRLDRRHGVDHGLYRLEIVDAVHRSVAACGCDQAVVRVLRKRRQMLVAHDLADANDGNVDWGHGVFRPD